MGQTSRAVEVLYQGRTDGRPAWTAGSGYLVGGSLVLTAAHNVGNGGNCVIRLEGGAELPAIMRLRGDPKTLDLAVVEITGDAFTPLTDWVRFALPASQRAELIKDCTALGFPRFKEDRTRPSTGTGQWLRAREQLDGEIPTGALGAGLLTFRVTSRPHQPPIPAVGVADSPWSGVSGAVVFARSIGDVERVVGVVTEHHLAEGPAALTLVSLDALDNLPGAKQQAWWDLLRVVQPGQLPRLPLNRVILGLAARSRLAPILDLHGLLGGRERELARLDGFLASPVPQYLVLTGEPGMGKTALLAGWIRHLLRDGRTDVCYHFLNRQFGSAGQQETMFSLVAQGFASWGRDMEPGSLGASVPALADMWLTLLALPPARPVVVVLDGADEAEAAGWQVPPTLFPRQLPQHVHLVVSARTMAGTDWRERLGLQHAATLTVDTLDDAGMRAVVEAAHLPDWVRQPDALTTLLTRVKGDPFYLRVLVDAVRSGNVNGQADLEATPTGLKDYIKTWWQDLTDPAKDKTVGTLLQYLTVARGPIRRTELVDIDADDELSGFTIDSALDKLRRFLIGDPSRAGVALSHWRLQQYLADDVLSPKERERALTTLLAWCDRWSGHHARYALTHVAAHQMEHASTPREFADLVRLLADPSYQRARIELADDTVNLFGDLHGVSSQLAGQDPVPVVALTVAGLEPNRARDRWLRPEEVFELARRGRVEDAVRRLGLLGPQPVPGWRHAAILLMAWVAAENHGGAARSLVDGAAAGAQSPPLDLLLGRVRATLGDTPEATFSFWYRPGMLLAGSNREEARAAVDRLGGLPFSDRLISGLPPVRDFTQANEAGIYLAETDAPHLVAFARDHPDEGDRWLSAYIDLHASNPYAVYRNRSLLSVLAAVCCLPDAAQARKHAVHLAVGAFASSPVRFAEYAALAALAQQARLGDTAARASLEQLRHQAEADAAQLTSTREDADRWGHHGRRLAAHAEVAHVVLGDTATAMQLLDRATTVPFGYAGYRATACLALAEAQAIVQPSAVHLRDAALRSAYEAAHNVQDPAFCSLVTARVNAIGGWWRSSSLGLGQLVQDFTAEPGAARFSPWHRLGERFPHRTPNDHIPIDYLSHITTLEGLAFELGLPRLAVAGLNPTPGSHSVVLPDPEFAPLMAGWISAQTLTQDIAPEDRVRLLSALVPTATTDPTLLDLVLGRLISALPASTGDQLGELGVALAGTYTAEPTGVRGPVPTR